MFTDTYSGVADTNAYSIYLKEGDKFYFETEGKNIASWSAARVNIFPML